MARAARWAHASGAGKGGGTADRRILPGLDPGLDASRSVRADHQGRRGHLHDIADLTVHQAGHVLAAEEVVIGGGRASWRVAADLLAAGARIGRAHLELLAHGRNAFVDVEAAFLATERCRNLDGRALGLARCLARSGRRRQHCVRAHRRVPTGILLARIDAREEMALSVHGLAPAVLIGLAMGLELAALATGSDARRALIAQFQAIDADAVLLEEF